MLTPRSTLTRRIVAALDASPSRIPVLVGGCGSGRTTLLHQLRERIGRTTAQYVDVERTATTPERFLRAVTGASPFPPVEPARRRRRPRRVRRDARLLRADARAAAASRRRSCSTSSSSCGPSRASPACAGCCTTSSTAWRRAATGSS